MEVPNVIFTPLSSLDDIQLLSNPGRDIAATTISNSLPRRARMKTVVLPRPLASWLRRVPAMRGTNDVYWSHYRNIPVLAACGIQPGDRDSVVVNAEGFARHRQRVESEPFALYRNCVDSITRAI